MTIAQHVHRLTRPHLSFTPDGKAGEVPSLLTELREAVTNSSADGGGGSSDGKPLPFDTGALELLRDIQSDAGEHYAERYGERFFGTLEGLLQRVAEDQHEGDWEAFFEHTFMEWTDRIENMIRPTKVRSLDNVECPSCEQKIHGPKRETCLIVGCFKPGGGRDLLPIEDWTATCRGCGAEWVGESMSWLVASLAA